MQQVNNPNLTILVTHLFTHLRTIFKEIKMSNLEGFDGNDRNHSFFCNF
jgi:hypothetical protein